MKNEPKSPFELALDARQKKLDPKLLTGSARFLYRDSSLSNEDLASYTNPKPAERTKQLIRPPVPMR